MVKPLAANGKNLDSMQKHWQSALPNLYDLGVTHKVSSIELFNNQIVVILRRDRKVTLLPDTSVVSG